MALHQTHPISIKKKKKQYAQRAEVKEHEYHCLSPIFGDNRMFGFPGWPLDLQLQVT